MKGVFVMIVGPSAVGKTELVRALLSKMPDAARLITTTTRPRRPDETNEYFFVSKEEFERGIAENDFFEYSEVYGNLYGPSKKVLDQFLSEHKYVFGIIDVQGARKMRDAIPDSVVIFIRPTSLDDLYKRMKVTRSESSEEELQKRLDTASHELSLAPTFDYSVENKEGHLEHTVEEVMHIVQKLENNRSSIATHTSTSEMVG